MNPPLWIEIVSWDKFQHYKDRRPVWIKLHLDLLDNHDYLALPESTRLLLIELWMLRGKIGSHLTDNTATLARQLGHRVMRAQLERLVDAGFIRVLASKPLAQRQSTSLREVQEADSPATQITVTNTLAGKLLGEIRDANSRTVAAIHGFELRLPDAAFARALESLKHRRSQGKPLASEARYVVATLNNIAQEHHG